MSERVGAAVLGPGNIGTDLLIKLRRSEVIDVRLIVGIYTESPGLARGAELGVETSAAGLRAVLDRDDIELVFDATSAQSHRESAPLLAERGKRVIDLTPAAVGPYVVPSTNLTQHLKAPNVNLVTCGGQATIPFVHAIDRVADASYAEIVATISSSGAGPGTRQNIDEFTETTARAIEFVGGADEGKAIIILNPAEPPILMRNTIYARVRQPDASAISTSVEAMVAEIAGYVPGISLILCESDGDLITVMLEVEGAGDFLPRYAGNLDIMTAAAARVGDVIAADMLGSSSVTITIVDSSLRDGMHSVAHQFTPDTVKLFARALDIAGVNVIEVSHGDGLGGSSIQYGIAAATDESLIEAAVTTVERAAIAVLLIPGIGTVRRLSGLRTIGATVARVATHCTEADIAQQHISWAREHGMQAIGFLMMSHMIAPAELADQAALMETYGAHAVYVVDSAGALTPTGTAERVAALRERLEIDVGFHAHNNLGCAVGNALAAVAAGATWLDGSIRGLGAGAGNAPTEVLCAALDRGGYETTVDLFALMDAAQDVVAPMLPRQPVIDRESLILGYAGVYSSFRLHAERAATKYGVDARDILIELLGRQRIVGGQEDMIIGVAAELARQGETSRR